MRAEEPVQKTIALSTNVDVGLAIFVRNTIHVMGFDIVRAERSGVGVARLLICSSVEYVRQNSKCAEIQKITYGVLIGEVGKMFPCGV